MTPTPAYAAAREVEPGLGSPWPGRELAQVRRTVRLAATVPLALLLGVQWLFVVGRGVPETAALPAHDWWLQQLGPLSLLDRPLGAGLLLAGSAAVTLLVRRGQHLGRAWLLLPALLGTLAALGSLLTQVVAGATALAVIGLLVWLTSTWWAVSHALLAGLAPRLPVTSRTGSVLVVAWVLLLPGPLAVGRRLLAPDLRAEAQALAANTEGLRFAALLTSASVPLWLFGALLGVLVWLVVQCWPRSARRSWRWYAALALCVVAVLELWWTAQTVAAQRVTQLRFGSPVDELHFTCATWVYPPDADAPGATPTLTVAVRGSGCDTVATFLGYHQVGAGETGVSVSPVALRRPGPAGSGDDDPGAVGSTLPRLPTSRSGALGPAGETRPLVGARYGDVVVLAGTDRVDRTADQVVAVPLRGGPALWRFVCGGKREVRARFAGGQPDPASTGSTPGEPGDVVVLTCGSRRLRLDPVTGLTAAR